MGYEYRIWSLYNLLVTKLIHREKTQKGEKEEKLWRSR